MKRVLLLLTLPVILIFASCGVEERPEGSAHEELDTTESRTLINNLLDSLNITAANADYNRYFSCYADDAVFAGTDATELWHKAAFMTWAKPHFDKKKTWNFKSLQRHIYFSKTGDVAWFDELLSTQMKICRGSGVVVLQDEHWKIEQYILSATVPNTLIDTVTSMKAAEEDSIINGLKK